MSGDYTITANFTGATLTMAVSPEGGGTTDPAVGTHDYAAETVVDITATAAEGYEFDSWTGDVADADAATTTVTMDEDQTVTANFATTVPYWTYEVDYDIGGSYENTTDFTWLLVGLEDVDGVSCSRIDVEVVGDAARRTQGTTAYYVGASYWYSLATQQMMKRVMYYEVPALTLEVTATTDYSNYSSSTLPYTWDEHTVAKTQTGVTLQESTASSRAELAATGVSVTVPAGTFDACTEINSYMTPSGGSEMLLGTTWSDATAGMVKWDYFFWDHDELYELVDYTLP